MDSVAIIFVTVVAAFVFLAMPSMSTISTYGQNVTGGSVDTTTFLLYESTANGFKVQYPPDCSPMEAGSLVTFCGVVVGDLSALLGKEFASLDEVTKEAINVDTGGGNAEFTSTPITLSGGLPANKIEVKGADGQLGLARIVTFKDNTAYTILLTPAYGKIDNTLLSNFQTVVDSFQITK